MTSALNNVVSTHPVISFAVFGALVYFVYLYVTYRVISPLRHIPGPFLWSISETPRTVASGLGRAAFIIHDFHNTYGDVVRIGPDTVIFRDKEAIKKVYGIGAKFNKSEFYLPFTFDPKDYTTFATLDNAAHAQRRSMHNRAWNRPSVLSQQDVVQEKNNAFIIKMREVISQNDVVDLVKWVGFLTHDVAVKMTAGIDSSCVQAGQPDRVLDISVLAPMDAFLGSFKALYAVLKLIPLPQVTKVVGAMTRVGAVGHDMLAEYRAKSPEDQAEARTVHQMMEDAQTLSLNDHAIVNEMFSFIVAGGDTTKMAICFMCQQTWSHPEFKVKLQEELDAAMPNADEVPSWEVASSLPLLSAACKETLRLFGSVPGILPRRGQPIYGDLQIGKYHIPAGTEIGCQPYTVHRDPEIYGEDVDEWRPERWLEDKERAEVMGRWNFAFGQGQRTCLGIYLAYLQFYLASAAIIRNFEGELVGSEKYKKLASEYDDYFTIHTRAKTMNMHLTRRV
ncbi:cytochrome P450 [Atractiella rhizophila]|nr:cytochrome P450 [Atractiella rhizophila]